MVAQRSGFFLPPGSPGGRPVGPAGPQGTTVRPFRLFLRAPAEKSRPPREADAVIHLSEPGVPGLPVYHNFREFWPLPGETAQEATAFLLWALGVWAADKLVPRALMPDAWTREIVLEYPSSPRLLAQAPQWAPLAAFLTGDTWTLKPRKVQINLEFAGTWPHSWQPTAVALFSGGLDSLAGVVNLLEEGQRLVLVSHYDYGQLAATQQTLAAGLRRYYGPERFYHLLVRVQLEGPELTLRSRSLLYLALGLTAAAAFPGPPPLMVPENGWISLNPPLTLNRLGTYSTRTTHPNFLGKLTTLWPKSPLMPNLVNPGQDLTKGEMLSRCRNLPLLEQLFPLSVSCARPVAGRWRRQPPGACGYCYPCLVRRAALHRLGWDRGEDYRVDVLAQPSALRHRVQGQDLRALCLALQTWRENPQEILARLCWGEGQENFLIRLNAVRRLLTAGFQEIAAWLRERGGPEVRDFLGMSDMEVL